MSTAMIPSNWVPSPDSSYASSGSNSTGSPTPPRCEISLLERLIRTHPLWFLPALQRSGALHLLQGREVGNFIVRSSREPDTMAVSVKLPGNQVEHYLLLKATEENRIALQDSEHSFSTVHQLIAHYCEHSDEIPVCLRVPAAIAEATTRQQLRSLALLGQEFWTISSPVSREREVKEQVIGSPPSDADSSQSHPLPSKSSGIGSQSSSSQNSLSDMGKKPCRPTTLELGKSRTLLTCAGMIGTPLSVPILPPTTRWLTPSMTSSQPSSVQSTPSELQSSMSDKISGAGFGKSSQHKRKSKNSSAKSIHYKDTEIIDLFKGVRTKSVLDDKISDYEDVWSNPHTPLTPSSCSRRLFTFKPDIIPNNSALDYESQAHNNNSCIHRQLTGSKSLSVCVTPTNGNVAFINNRLSLKNISINVNPVSSDKENEEGRPNKPFPNLSIKGMYSEPIDSMNNAASSSRKQGTNRWSQPALSLLNSQVTHKNRSVNNNGKQKRILSVSKSTDNLNQVSSLREREVSDSNVTLHYKSDINTLKHPTTSSSWKVDSSWQFCSNQKTESQLNSKNMMNRLMLDEMMRKDKPKTYSDVEEPLSPSPENWENLLRLVNESTKELESLQVPERDKNFNEYAGQEYPSPGNPFNEAQNSIRLIVEDLATRDNGVFGPMLKSFVSCTCSGKLQDPFKVLRNIRQFISGLKNYLVGLNPESEKIHFEIKKQSERLQPSEFLNVDLILENILVDLVIRPLYSHVMKLLLIENQKSRIICNHNPDFSPRNVKISRIYQSFENNISPILKLESWNKLVEEVQTFETRASLPDFVQLLSSSVRKICSPSIESHADFVVGLLPPCISERNSYSISLLQSVVSALKLPKSQSSGTYDLFSSAQTTQPYPTAVRVIVPDERNGTLIRKLVPVRESTTGKDVAKVLSSKLGITNAGDYVLVVLNSGEETVCQESNKIQDLLKGQTFSALAYRRLDAKIGWPIKIN